jgi:hypothetical protein
MILSRGDSAMRSLIVSCVVIAVVVSVWLIFVNYADKTFTGLSTI